MDEHDEGPLFASIQLSPIATVITNPRLPDNPIVSANAMFAKLTRYPLQEILGRNCRFLAGPESEPSSQAVLRDAVRHARPVLVEILNYRRDGEPFRNAVMIAPLFDKGGRIAYFLGSQMDVTATAAMPSVRRQRSRDVVRGLTPRQREVLEKIMNGYRSKQIAAALGISEKTVKMHRAGLLAKLGVPTSADAVRIAVEAEL
jgi:PAS domain S-box-containing protein